MKKWTWSIAGLLIIVGSLLVMGFSSNKHTQWGKPASVGDGQIKTFVTLNGSGKPKEVGVVFTEAMLTGLPDQVTETKLAFPASIEATSLDHFVLDWNPAGHEPEGVYTVPHFDFHFYAVTEQDLAG